MRLIDTLTLEFKEFIGSNVPEYAILSHTWEDEEVTFQEFSTLSDACRAKKGFLKIEQTCRLAREKKLDYAWVDTCCIDKSSSAELTEAINSMFTWYEESVICYAYLSDLHMINSIEDELPKCRWFTRGWTLQELIAPIYLEFYDANWQLCGDKNKLGSLLQSITSIPDSIISGGEHFSIEPIAKRMSWAKDRETTRIEDIAYCLLGIFDVNMPLLYGEGNKAFIRLQEEIIRKDPDASLFLWEASEHDSDLSGILAPTPSRFTHHGDIRSGIQRQESTVTNKGIRMTTELLSTVILGKIPDRDGPTHIYLLPFCKSGDILGLVVEKLPNGAYARANRVCGGVLKTSTEQVSSHQMQTIYMMPTGTLLSSFTWDEVHGVHGCKLELGTGLRILQATPEKNWDPSTSIIRRNFPMAFLLAFGSQPPNLFVLMSMNFAEDESLYVMNYSNPGAPYIFTKMAELKLRDTVLSEFWGLEAVRFDENGLGNTKIRTGPGDMIVHLQRRVGADKPSNRLGISCSL